MLGLTVSVMSDLIDMSLIEAAVEDPSALSADVQAVGAILFYGTAVGAIMHSLNAVSGLFRGTMADADRATSSSITMDDYSLVTPTSVRKILAGGADLDTTVVPVGESDDAGGPTEL